MRKHRMTEGPSSNAPLMRNAPSTIGWMVPLPDYGKVLEK